MTRRTIDDDPEFLRNVNRALPTRETYTGGDIQLHDARTSGHTGGALDANARASPWPPSDAEREQVILIAEMLGSGEDQHEKILNVLRKNGGDAQKACTALLDDPTPDGYRSPPPRITVSPGPNMAVDDDDDELERAKKLSLEPQFGPSDRAPDSNWAMVPSSTQNQAQGQHSTLSQPYQSDDAFKNPFSSNVSSTAASQEEQSLNQAIEASLNDHSSAADEKYVPPPLNEHFRQDARPAYAWVDDARLTYASLLLQALYTIPHVRERLSAWRPTEPGLDHSSFPLTTMPQSSPYLDSTTDRPRVQSPEPQPPSTTASAAPSSPPAPAPAPFHPTARLGAAFGSSAARTIPPPTKSRTQPPPAVTSNTMALAQEELVDQRRDGVLSAPVTPPERSAKLPTDAASVSLHSSRQTEDTSASVMDDAPLPPLSPPRDGPEGALWALLTTFAHMDHSISLYYEGTLVIAKFRIAPIGSRSVEPGKLAAWFLGDVGRLCNEAVMRDFPQSLRLFHRTVVVPIWTMPSAGPGRSNDLLSALSSMLNSADRYIVQPADIFTFELSRTRSSSSGPNTVDGWRSESSSSWGSTNSGWGSTGSGTGAGSAVGGTERFTYPKEIYLDPFLKANEKLSLERQSLRRDLEEQAERLEKRRKALVSFEGRNTLADLRASIYYYEEVAPLPAPTTKDITGESEPAVDHSRDAVLQDTAKRLRAILEKIEAQVKELDAEVEKLKREASAVLDAPDMRKHRYDLRVVMVHDGLPGRKHLYSYVRHRDRWWKTLDGITSEVAEQDVLEDSTGLHLEAGPFLLMYARAREEGDTVKADWPEALLKRIREDNESFRKHVPEAYIGRAFEFIGSTDEQQDGVKKTTAPPVQTRKQTQLYGMDMGP